jgi:hypothetical protein
MSACTVAATVSPASNTLATGYVRALAVGYKANFRGAQSMWSGLMFRERVLVRISQEQHESNLLFYSYQDNTPQIKFSASESNSWNFA